MEGGAEVPPGAVVITPKEMYDEIRATHEAVRDLQTSVKRPVEDLQVRVAALEKWKWWATGAAAGAATVLARVWDALQGTG